MTYGKGIYAGASRISLSDMATAASVLDKQGAAGYSIAHPTGKSGGPEARTPVTAMNETDRPAGPPARLTDVAAAPAAPVAPAGARP